MAAEPVLFGRTHDGEPVHSLKITGGGLTVDLMSWGAGIRDLRMDGHDAPLVLGFEEFEHYPVHSPYFGVTAGRYANRIAHGRFTIDGTGHQLDRNEKGANHLHGGTRGIGRRVWSIAEHGADFCRFEIADPDGHMGYPGNCGISCTYRLKPGGVLSVVLEAETDRPTLCNLAHHSYFNLDGGDTILDHEAMIAADHYLPVDGELIPTGEICAVAGTEFDFTEMRPIRLGGRETPFGYDHNFCLSDARGPKRAVALVRSLCSGIAMEVWTGEPGLQFYTGLKLNVPVPGLDGRRYGSCGGFCMESQVWPDSPNHPQFPSAVLRPGTRLLQETDYIFSRE
ncbi:aldose epimerase family protein [Nitratireductor sp. XY-223]|uniref:aldose epimerase family protein n=1 Tax=Nitratireductor sp. XY-223 TaxID=2561926 RepID=UPI0010AA7380|nr:aldose epimerase family protein [Nitratireductor sp. XY-223]